MSREDVLAHAARRETRARERLVRDFDREFSKKKLEIRKAQKAARSFAEEEEAARLRLKEEEQQREIAHRLAEKEEVDAVSQDQLRAAEAAAKDVCQQKENQIAPCKRAAEEQRALVEMRRQKELLAEENRKFESLYRQNRSCLAAYRSKEESLRGDRAADRGAQSQAGTGKNERPPAARLPGPANSKANHIEVDMPTLPPDFGCSAAEIAEFAQKLSALSPLAAGLDLDETATFFTQS